MRIGIIQCDSVLQEFQPQFGDYPQMFMDLFRKVDKNLTFQVYDARLKQFPSNLDECDAYISTGSRLGVYDDIPWLTSLEDFILKLSASNKKFVAVCFAHQLVATLFGGNVEKSDKGWGVGVAENKLTTKKAWMETYQPTIKLIVSHQDQVTKLPPQAELLATSDFCPNYLCLYASNILTVQGHPEFTHNYSLALMTHRQKRIGLQRYQQGVASLNQDTDSLLFTRWMLNFMTQ